MGIAVPVAYFGTQLLAAPFYPGYSFRARDASTLGSLGSSHPGIFNVGSILVGLALVTAAWGFGQALRRRSASRVVSWATGLSLLAGGIGSINAGVHPLPDPRHTAGRFAAAGAGLFLVPLLLPLAARRVTPPRAPLRVYLAANLVLIIGLALVMSGLVQRVSMMTGSDLPGFQDFLNNNQGLLQRLAALGVFVPIGVCALAFAPSTAERSTRAA